MDYRSGATLVVVAGLMWSGMGLAIRLLDGAGTWQVLIYRSLGAIPMLLAYLGFRYGRGALARVLAIGWHGVVGGIGLVAAFAGAIYAIQNTSVANAVFLFAAAPLLTALIARAVLGEPIRRATWGAMLAAGVGMGIMVGGGLASGAMAGNLAALASAAGFAVFSVALRARQAQETVPVVIVGASLAALTGWAVLGLTGGSLAVSVHDLAICLAMGAFILGLAMVFYTLGSRVVPSGELVLLSQIEVVMAPVWVWLVLGETARPATLIGGAVILCALVFNGLTGSRARRTPFPPPM